MLNDRLTIPDLLYDLETLNDGSLKEKKFLDSVDIITNEILFEEGKNIKLVPIRQNKSVLAQLHHNLLIANYKKPEFRKKLLLRADPEELIIFLKQVGSIAESANNLPDSLVSICEKASSLKWGNNPETNSFVKVFGYSDSIIPLTKDIRDPVEVISVVKKNSDTGQIFLPLYSERPFRQLYSYQSKIFYEAQELVENRHMRFIIQMPTGSGKTRVGMEIISHFLNQGVINEKERQVIWLADIEELLEQAIESFKSIFPHLGLRDTNLYRIWSGYKPDKIEGNSIVMANYKTLINFVRDHPDSLKPDLIVCDEAHNAVAETYKPLIESLVKKGTRVIGLTATPVRTISGKQNDELKEFFAKRIVDIEIDDDSENVISFLQKKGYLSHVRKHDINTGNIESSIPIEILKLASRARDLPDSFLQIMAENNVRNKKIALELYEICKQKTRTLYFGTNVYQSQLMCAVMMLLGINAVHIDGTTPIDYRRDCIKKFKDGIINLICNFDVFTTGFDEPKIDAIVIGRPTKSIVLHQQMIGRGMRGPKMCGTEEFDLYRVSFELPSIDLADNYFTEFWSL